MVSANPFDDESLTFVVLANEENQHSLWPAHIDIPAGWAPVHPADTRAACLDYIESNWADIRPRSVVESAEAQS